MATALTITTVLTGDCEGLTPLIASLIHPNTNALVGRTITAGVWTISAANVNLPANGISVAIDNGATTSATCSLDLLLVPVDP